MAMARRVCPCGICENANAPSVCSSCINIRLIDRYKHLKRLSKYRDNLHAKVQARLKAKHDAYQQLQWKNVHNDNISKLKDRLQESENNLRKAREGLIAKQHDLDTRSHHLAIAMTQLAKKQVEQLGQRQPDHVRTHHMQLTNISLELHLKRRSVFRQLCKIFPLKYMASSSVGGSREASASQFLTICGVRLPPVDDPHSVRKDELGTSLGYMLHLLQLAAHYLSAPLLHNARFKGSTSKIWQRSSYWDPGPSKSEEYPLFVPTHGGTHSEEQTFSEKGSSSMGFSTIDGSLLEHPHASSSRYGSNSLTALEMNPEVRKGIKLLRRSIGCVSSYGFSQISPSTPPTMGNFHAFTELLIHLSSKEYRLRTSRASQHQINSLAESSLSNASTMETSGLIKDGRGFRYRNINTGASFYCIVRDGDQVGENVLDEWDMVEHPTLPPPPSDSEDVEHWTRAMFVDATK